MFVPRETFALVPVLLDYFNNNKSKITESMDVNLETTAKYYS